MIAVIGFIFLMLCAGICSSESRYNDNDWQWRALAWVLLLCAVGWVLALW